MGLLKLFNVSDDKSLVLHERSFDLFVVNYLTGGDLQSIEYMRLTRNVEGGFENPWTKVSVGTYALGLGLYLASDGTELSYQNSWTDDAVLNRKSGVLSLNTAAIDTAFGVGAKAGATLNCVLEVQCTDGDGNPGRTYRQGLLLVKGYITAGSVVPPAGEEAATQAWVKGLFCPKEMAGNGDQMIWKDANGQKYLVYMGTDGLIHCDAIPN